MIIPVRKTDQGSQEWAIIELHGDLQSCSSESVKEEYIGDLHFKKNGTPVLIIGAHVLYGKEISLDKPIAITEKIRYNKNDLAIEEDSLDIVTRTEYVVKGIIKKKLIFKNRPIPIISDVPKSN